MLLTRLIFFSNAGCYRRQRAHEDTKVCVQQYKIQKVFSDDARPAENAVLQGDFSHEFDDRQDESCVPELRQEAAETVSYFLLDIPDN